MAGIGRIEGRISTGLSETLSGIDDAEQISGIVATVLAHKGPTWYMLNVSTLLMREL